MIKTRAGKRANVVLVNVDQLRLDILEKLPVFSRLKKKSLFFPEMITHAPYTIASMYAIFSGLYGRKSGVDAYYKALSFKEKKCHTLTQYLKDYGYYTKADVFSDILIPHQGFDEVLVHDEYKDNLTKRHCGILTELSRKKNNYFVFLQYSKIHAGMVKNVTNKFDDFNRKYFSNRERNIKRYTAYARMAGKYISSLLSCADKLDLFSNTIFIIFTDHGCGLGERPGEKTYGVYLYDYTIKVFCSIINGKIPSNITVRKMVRTIDIMPTILSFLSISPRKEYAKIQGRSLLPLLFDKNRRIHTAFAETGGLGGPWPSPYKPNIHCIRTDKWKLIFNSSTGAKELYNIKIDKEEIYNLHGQGLDVEKKLWRRLRENLKI